MENNLSPLTVIEGIVTPCKWDESGTVTAVTISAKDEEEYVIDAGLQGEDLMKFLHSLVRAKGLLRSEMDAEVFVVKDYEVIC